MIEQNKRAAVALGFFDGLHLAHRRVLESVAARREQGLLPCVLLFDDHPQHVLNGKQVPKLLQNDKRDALLRAGVSHKFISFPGGAHGLGLAADDPVIRQWFPECVKWLKKNGF